MPPTEDDQSVGFLKATFGSCNMQTLVRHMYYLKRHFNQSDQKYSPTFKSTWDGRNDDDEHVLVEAQVPLNDEQKAIVDQVLFSQDERSGNWHARLSNGGNAGGTYGPSINAAARKISEHADFCFYQWKTALALNRGTKNQGFIAKDYYVSSQEKKYLKELLPHLKI